MGGSSRPTLCMVVGTLQQPVLRGGGGRSPLLVLRQPFTATCQSASGGAFSRPDLSSSVSCPLPGRNWCPFKGALRGRGNRFSACRVAPGGSSGALVKTKRDKHTAVRMSKVQNSNDTKCHKNVGQQGGSVTAAGCAGGVATMGDSPGLSDNRTYLITRCSVLAQRA